MSWLGRTREAEPPPGEQEAPPAPVERAAPGVAALFEGLAEDGRHAVLDLGPASGEHLRIFRRYGRRVCFGDLLPNPPRGEAWREALAAVPVHPGGSYDVVLLWDVLDRVAESEREALVARLVELTSPGARLWAVVESSDEVESRSRRYALRGVDRVAWEPAGPVEPGGRKLLPAEVERLLQPFEILRAFTLRSGFREYVAARP